MTNAFDTMMDEIFEQFETASHELETENNNTWEISLEEFLEIERDTTIFNDLVEKGIIELN